MSDGKMSQKVLRCWKQPTGFRGGTGKGRSANDLYERWNVDL